MPTPQQLPTPFESLAALSKFASAAEIAPEFYARHYHPIEMANAFMADLCSCHRNLQLMVSFTGAPASETAKAIEGFFRTTPLPQLDMNWVDEQMTIVMQQLLPVVRDPALPPFLRQCRWPIEGAFEPPQQ